jgi:LysM repeat protein
MKASRFSWYYLFFCLVIFTCLVSIPIFAQNDNQNQDNVEETEAPHLQLTICEDEVEATEEQLRYIVQEGDTLESIASSHEIELEDLAAANELEVDAQLEAGQELLIPSTEGVEPADCIPSSEIEIWYINTSGASNALVRSCPDRSCEVLLRLPFASSISVFATENGWHSILLEDGTVGYVSTNITSPYLPQLPTSVPDNTTNPDTPEGTPGESSTAGDSSGGTSNGSTSSSGGSSSGGSGGGGGGGITPTPTRPGDPND